MKPMIIDFALSHSPWHWNLRRSGVRIFIVLVITALFAGSLAWTRGLHLMEAEQTAREALAHLQEQQNGAVAALQSEVRVGVEEETLIRQAERQRNLPWETIFQAFEAAPLVHLQVFEPDMTRGLVKVQAQTPSLAAAQDYLRALQTNAVFSRVSLSHHEALADGAGVLFHFETTLAGNYRLPEQDEKGKP